MGKGGGGKKVTVTTYSYRIRFAVAISFGPIDTFVRFDYNSDFKNYNAARGGSDSIALDTSDSLLYGSFYFGTVSQGGDSSLAVMHSPLTYRHIAYASFRCDLGQSPAMPATAFTLCRYYCPLDGIDSYNTFASSLGLNPAQIIYDLLTNKFYGFGLSAAVVDAESFRIAGTTLYEENLGVGTTLSGGELYNVIRAILDWVDGELVYDETFGYIKMLLRRQDYTYEALPEVFESDMKAQSFELNRTSWYATKNVIYLNFLDIARECDQNCVYTEDLGNYNITGNCRVQEFNFDIFTDQDTAQRVCNRLIHRHSYPYAKVVFECFGTTGDDLDIFGPFRLYHSYYGIWGRVYRVTEKRRQGPNLWKIEAIEETFPPASLYDSQAINPYDPPYFEPVSIVWSFRELESYYRGVLILGYSEDQTAGHTTLDALGVQTDYCANQVDYACIGRLKTEVGTGHDANLYLDPDKHFVVDDPADLEYILVDDEIMKIDSHSISTDEIYYFVSQASRAQEDTVEGTHAINARVYAIECRAFLAENLHPGFTYNMTLTPHYMYPKPFYNTDDQQTTILNYQGLILTPMQPSDVSANDSNFLHDITFSWTQNNRQYPQPIPCDGLSSYPQQDVGGGQWQDQILGWKVCHSLPPGNTSLLTMYLTPSELSFTSTYAARTAAGLSHSFQFEVYARGMKGYDSPYSSYIIS